MRSCDRVLRGRGGAGFSTGTKWKALPPDAALAEVRLCNADEGDPGAFMDRQHSKATRTR